MEKQPSHTRTPGPVFLPEFPEPSLTGTSQETQCPPFPGWHRQGDRTACENSAGISVSVEAKWWQKEKKKQKRSQLDRITNLGAWRPARGPWGMPSLPPAGTALGRGRLPSPRFLCSSCRSPPCFAAVSLGGPSACPWRAVRGAERGVRRCELHPPRNGASGPGSENGNLCQVRNLNGKSSHEFRSQSCYSLDNTC